MTAHPDLAERYIRLAHAIDAHAPGFIDGYGGPAEWADRTPRPANEVQADAERLLDQVETLAEGVRRDYLRVQARAMHTQARLLAGEALGYREEVRLSYDLEPPREPESTFEAALRELDAALPGTGELADREAALRGRVTLPKADILRVAEPIVAELRRRTRAAFGLPEGEDFSLALVEGKPWSGYNWPLGHYQSRVELNTDLPVILPALPNLLAHEGYPGHHTEHALKEERLAQGRGWQEFSIQLLHAPECVVSEGIATQALAAVMERAEVEAWLTGELAARAGLDPEDVRAYLHATRAREQLERVNGNAALLLHEDGRPEAEVLAYLRHYGARTQAQAAKSLQFITAPASRSYVFTYTVGGGLVERAMQAGDRQRVFGRLLTEPFTPGGLRALAEGVPSAASR